MYSWGTNPNNHFKMYWKDAANVIQDLDQFQALYIEVHGCVWSECGVDNFDDDGENHDGDETWYETRTRTFCANAAYSLYGIKKNNFKLVNTCSKGTYINSFFTYGGADVLAKALDLSISNKDGNRYTPGSDDDVYGYSSSTKNSDCVAVDNNGRRLSGSQDEEDAYEYYYKEDGSAKTVATTMGCAASPTSKYDKFVLAGFSDTSCMGRNFVETLDSYQSYNRAMKKVSCHRIWDLGSYKRQNKGNDDGNVNNDDLNADDLYNMDDDAIENRQLNENENNNNGYKRVYHSVAEQLLYQSWACDLSLYPEMCPDPYGLKRKYTNVLKAAANGQPIQFAVWNARLRKPIQFLTWLLFVIGFYLAVFAYSIRNRAFIRNNGGGVKGFASVVWRDVCAAVVALRDEIKKANERYSEKRRSKRSGGSGNRKDKSSSRDNGVWATLFGKSKKKKKKKRRSKEQQKSLKRTPSGRSVEEFHDEEGSVYTELTDEYSPSQKSKGSSRPSNANYSSSRTSRAAEAAFAAAAQFDLEQQQAAVSPNRHHHPSILPSASNGGKRSRSAGKNRPRGRSRSPSGSSTRSKSLPRRARADPSPQRSPGGSRIGRSNSQRSRSPQHHRIV